MSIRILSVGTAAALALAMAGCVAGPELTAIHNPSEVAWAAGSGTGSVSGEAFMRQQGGGVVTAAGEEVMLCPDSTYGRNLAAVVESRVLLAGGVDADNSYLATCRRTIAGVDGDFLFTNLPAGTYYIFTQVRWMVPGSYFPTGGYLVEPVSVTSGTETRTVLAG